MKSLLLAVCLIVLFVGCAPQLHYVHPALTQAEVNKISFECDITCTEYAKKFGSYNPLFYSDCMGRCYESRGFELK